ncbi:MAG: ribosome maturation factor RimM [Pyrinomonadaceae bacterium]
MSVESTEDLITIARIVKTRGLRGEVVAQLLTDFPERFDDLAGVTVTSSEKGERRELKIESFFFQKGRIVLKFEGFDTVEEGEELRGSDVCVPESESVALESDEFFDWQLAGCVVETIGGKSLGTVREVMRTGGTELLVVAGEEKEYLIPFAESICATVDIENKMIRIDPPEGLLEF